MRSLVIGALAALSGLVCAIAFDPLALPYAMLVGVAGLLLLLRRLSDAPAWRVTLVGVVFGVGFMAPLIWWMNAVSSGAFVALVLAESVFFGLLALALRTVMRLRGWPVWAAGVWVGFELVRGAFPFTGFPWGRLAHTSIDTPFAPYVRLVGMPGTSAILFIVVAMIVLLITTDSARVRAQAVALVVVAVVVGMLLPTGLAGADGTRRVAAIQGNTPTPFPPWPRGELFELHIAETERLAERIESGEEPRPDMVLWPETATDIDPFVDPAARRVIESLSARLDAPLLIGGLLDGPTEDTAYNAGVVWDADGPGDRYVKRKVVPYGEYVPFRRQLGGIVPRFDRDIPRDMLAGDSPGDLSIAGTVIGDTICWDIAYDGIVREALAEGAQMLVVQTSNASFTGTSQPAQQWKISRLRAIETGRYVVVPSTNGISGIADADGKVVALAERETPQTLTATVGLAAGTTPALVLSRWIEYALTVVGLLGLVLGRRANRGER